MAKKTLAQSRNEITNRNLRALKKIIAKLDLRVKKLEVVIKFFMGK